MQTNEDALERLDDSNDSGNSSRSTGAEPCRRVALIVPRALVKKTKDALEARGELDKRVKIRPAGVEDYNHGGCNIDGSRSDLFVIPTTKLSAAGKSLLGSDSLPVTRGNLVRCLGLEEYETEIYEVITFGQGCDNNSQNEPRSVQEPNPLARTVYRWLAAAAAAATGPPTDDMSIGGDGVVKLSSSCNWTYMVYPPLLLLPPSFLKNLSRVFDDNGKRLPGDLSALWGALGRELGVSHVAMNAPILATSSMLANAPREASIGDVRDPEANILRSPTGLTPLYGDFGLALPPTHIPNTTDFTSAFWCTARQNGIFQTWAPRYSMFSRGNISEKARVLGFKTLTKTQFGNQPGEMSAVDLYAGIGYFAFSYAKPGFGKVLCWEINPWSVEGLRRGAKMNNWDVKVIKNHHTFTENISGDERLVVFQESNEHAAKRIAAVKDRIPPVRHVNCGLLPSSKDSWQVAVQVLDPTGGWIHVHENIARSDIESRRVEIVEIFNQLVMKNWVHELGLRWDVKCDHIEQVKSYAPGVIHCVLDVSVLPVG